MDRKIMRADIHDASFSSYLNTSVDGFVLKRPESARSPISLEETKTKEDDISVFGAEKYFSMELDDEKSKTLDINTPSKHGMMKGIALDYQQTRPRSRPGTPSVSSEASWNSQAALLQSSLRNLSRGRQQKFSRKWLLASFACNRSCSDENSIFVHENVPQGTVHGQDLIKQPIQVAPSPVKRSQQSIPMNREEHSGMQRLNVVEKLLKEEMKGEEEELEEFGSKFIKKGDVQWYLERKLSMLTWDAIPRSQNVTTVSASGQVYADIESEGSSDLFEIENLSGTGKPPYDSSFMASTTYEPSEKSIEWSVATASATDFSAVSDYYKMKMAGRPEGPHLATKPSQVVETKSLTYKEVQRSRPSSLLGCKSHKTVRVAEKSIQKSTDKANPSNSRIKGHLN